MELIADETMCARSESTLIHLFDLLRCFFFLHFTNMFCVLCCFPVVEVLSECCLLSYMARVENRLSFLFRLVNIINVQTLTQVWVHLHLATCFHRRSWWLFSKKVCLKVNCKSVQRHLAFNIFFLIITEVCFSTGECQLFKHQFGDFDVGQKKG